MFTCPPTIAPPARPFSSWLQTLLSLPVSVRAVTIPRLPIAENDITLEKFEERARRTSRLINHGIFPPDGTLSNNRPGPDWSELEHENRRWHRFVSGPAPGDNDAAASLFGEPRGCHGNVRIKKSI